MKHCNTAGRGLARILPEVRRVFQISLLPPPPQLQIWPARRNHPLSTAKTGLGENNVFTFYTIPSSNENRLSDVAEKSLLFWKAAFGCQKNKQSGILRKILQRIKNAIEAICDCRRCCFNFNTFFFYYTLIWFYPISFYCFYPPLFQVRPCRVILRGSDRIERSTLWASTR